MTIEHASARSGLVCFRVVPYPLFAYSIYPISRNTESELRMEKKPR